MLQVVTMSEIEKVFSVTDRIGIHRENVVIPLRPAHPGRVRRMPNGKFEIVVEADDLDPWLSMLEGQLRHAGA